MFHVSKLRKYRSDPKEIIHVDQDIIEEGLGIRMRPINILQSDEKKL